MVAAVEKQGIDKDEDMIVLKESLALIVKKELEKNAVSEETLTAIKKEIAALPDCPEYAQPTATLPFEIWSGLFQMQNYYMNSEGRVMNDQHKETRRKMLKEGNLQQYEQVMVKQQQ